MREVEVDEVKEDKIAGVIHIPLGLLDFRMHELDKGTEYTMVCPSGDEAEELRNILTVMTFR